MGKLYIPQVGDLIVAKENWSCSIFNESRNKTVFNALNIDTQSVSGSNISITFPKGTVFKVSRLYVRAPASSYDSITFTIVNCPIASLKKARFWVKLHDTKNLEYEELMQNFNSFTKIDDLVTFIALSKKIQNSKHMTTSERNFVGKEIHQYLLDKKLPEFSFTIPIESSFIHKFTHCPFNSKSKKDIELALSGNNENPIIHVQVIPFFDDFLVYFNSVPLAQKIEEMIEPEPSSYYYQGNYFANGYYMFVSKKLNKKRSFGSVITDCFNFPFSEVTLEGNVLKVKNLKEFNTFLNNMKKSMV